MGSWNVVSERIFAQPSDPGSVGAGAVWTDTNANLTYRRNDLNTDWILIGGDANVSSTEYGYLDGVTSAIQTQISAKLASTDNITINGVTKTLSAWLTVGI